MIREKGLKTCPRRHVEGLRAILQAYGSFDTFIQNEVILWQKQAKADKLKH
jgi:hypothetical protein